MEKWLLNIVKIVSRTDLLGDGCRRGDRRRGGTSRGSRLWNDRACRRGCRRRSLGRGDFRPVGRCRGGIGLLLRLFLCRGTVLRRLRRFRICRFAERVPIVVQTTEEHDHDDSDDDPILLLQRLQLLFDIHAFDLMIKACPV